MRHVSCFFRVWRAAVPVLAVAIGACSYLPDVREVKLPQVSTFVPTNANEFNRASVNTNRPVSAGDLVDGQGLCPGVVPAGTGSDAAVVDRPIRGVGLDMTECEVAVALGPPQSAEVSTDGRGQRNVVMTYTSGDRPGIYRFVGGRLVTIERGAEQSPPPVAKKQPPARQQAKKPAPSVTTTVQ